MKKRMFILILLSVSLVWAQGRRGGGSQMTWDESLNLTTEQMQQITELRDAMQPAMQTMRQNTRTLQQELRQLQRSSDSDADRIAELETTIAANEAAIEALMTGHRDQIRSLLTADQQVIFDQHNFGPREDRGPGRDGRRGGNSPGPRGNRQGNGRW